MNRIPGLRHQKIFYYLPIISRLECLHFTPLRYEEDFWNNLLEVDPKNVKAFPMIGIVGMPGN